MKKIQLILADDHQLFRHGIKALLQTNPAFEVVGEAANGEELSVLLSEQVPDVILLDITMPPSSGIVLLSTLQEQYPTVRCIMLTMHDDAQYVMESLRKGADGYLLKDADQQELHEAIHAVMAGDKHFKNKISDLIVQDLADTRSGKALLTERETQIVRLVADGKITKEIADQLHVSTRTVETHRSRIMKKLKVANTAEMIRAAYQQKLI